jgi:hypothetical protein
MTKGLPPPDPRSLCPLSSTEFVEPPLKKIPGYTTRDWRKKSWEAVARKWAKEKKDEEEEEEEEEEKEKKKKEEEKGKKEKEK